MRFKIDKKIPLPDHYKTGKVSKYPFPEMKVGDSFFVPGKSTAVKAAAFNWSKRNKEGKWKFCSSARDGGMRIWRLK